MSATVLVLGGTGMLGHRLVRDLPAHFETWSTVRGAAVPASARAVLDPERTVTGVRAEELASVDRALDRAQPDVVVNAIGIVKQSPLARDPLTSITVNSLFPHEVAARCAARDVRLVHISTDCVFSGRSTPAEGYTEDDLPDPVDLYGRSKLLGETTGPGALTVRTSFIGPEQTAGTGLLEWFLAEAAAGRSVTGYRRALFSGLTAAALSRLIALLVAEGSHLTGVVHAAGDPIDKYSLLLALREAFGLDVAVEAADTPVLDRRLSSARLRALTGWTPPTWPQMLAELASEQHPGGSDAHR